MNSGIPLETAAIFFLANPYLKQGWLVGWLVGWVGGLLGGWVGGWMGGWVGGLVNVNKIKQNHVITEYNHNKH